MEKQQKYVLTPIAGAVAAALSPAQQVLAQDNSAALEEIVVTATKCEGALRRSSPVRADRWRRVAESHR